MNPPKRIRVHFTDKRFEHLSLCQGLCKKANESIDYILLSEHEKEIEKRLTHCIKICEEDKDEQKEFIKVLIDDTNKEISGLKKQLAESKALVTSYKSEVAEKDEKTKALETASVCVIRHQKQEIAKLREERQRKYDEIAELKKMLVAMAKRLPIPSNVTITHAFAEKLLSERQPELIAKKRKSSLMKAIW